MPTYVCGDDFEVVREAYEEVMRGSAGTTKRPPAVAGGRWWSELNV